MSDTTINNGYIFQQSYAQSTPLTGGGPDLSTLAATQGTGGQAANPEKQALAFLAQMSQAGAGQYGAAHGVMQSVQTQQIAQTQQTQQIAHTHNVNAAAQTAQLKGQTFTPTMPPPKAPRVQINAQTSAAFSSFASESKGAMQNIQQWVSQQPSIANQKSSSLINANSKTTDAIAHDATTWLANTQMGSAAFANGGMAAFMKLRIENTDKSINAMQDLAGSSNDLQGVMAEQQAAAAQAAQEQAQKAQKKSGILGIFQKVFAVVLAVVLTVAAICTADPALAAAGIAIAAVAFAVAGAVKGAKSGKGFDFWGGLDWFNNLVGVGALGGVLKSIGKAAIDGAAKMIEQSAKEGTQVVQEAFESALGTGAKGAAGEGVEGGTSQAAKEGAEETAKAGATAGATAGKGGVSAESTTAEQIAQEQERSLRRGFNKIFSQLKDMIKTNLLKEGVGEAGSAEGAAGGGAGSGAGAGAEGGGAAGAKEASVGAQTSAEDGAEAGSEEGAKDATKEGAEQGGKKAAEKTSMFGDKGRKIAFWGSVSGVAEGGDQMGSSIIQLQSSLYQANADEDMAHFQQLKAVVTMLDSSYKTANDLVQTLIKSHSNGVDQAQSMLKNNNDAMNAISNNMSQI